jgi:hypothetical protein
VRSALVNLSARSQPIRQHVSIRPPLVRRISANRYGAGREEKESIMPRFMAIILGDAPKADEDVAPEVWQQIMDDYNEFGAEAGAAGVVAGGEALEPPSTAVGIKLDGKGGALTRTDAPFAEAKEVVGGFYLLDCDDMEEAIKWASRIPGAWLGHVVVQPCIDFSGGD